MSAWSSEASGCRLQQVSALGLEDVRLQTQDCSTLDQLATSRLWIDSQGLYMDTSHCRRRMVRIGRVMQHQGGRSLMKGLWIVALAALCAASFAAERVVLFEEFTQTG